VLVAVESAQVREALVAMLGALDRFRVVAEVDNADAAVEAGHQGERALIRVRVDEIENAGNRDDHWVPEHFERLIGGRERDPMKMNRQTRGENREIKINSGETSEPERDAEEIQPIHMKIMGAAE